jgi:60 kDa SS-A/Ro ribonucleoprotein
MSGKTSDQIVFALNNSEEALANYTLNQTFGATCVLTNTGPEPARVIELARQCDPLFVAQLAIFSYEKGKLRDIGALLTAYISSIPELFKVVAPRVLNNMGQIRKFVHYKRSGIVGSKSLGTVPKRYIQDYILALSPRQLFRQAIGQSPSVADVIRLTHPKPTEELHYLFRYLLGFDVEDAKLLPEIQELRAFLRGEYPRDQLPSVPMEMLQPHLGKMSRAQRYLYVQNLSANQLRRQLTLLNKQGAFNGEDWDATELVVEKLSALTQHGSLLPVSLYTSLQNLNDLPEVLKEALAGELEMMLECAARELNVLISRPLTVAIDCSGSMDWRMSLSKTTDVSAYEVAVLFAYALRKNPLVQIVTVETFVRHPRGYAETKSLSEFNNCIKAVRTRGGTALSTVLQATATPDTLIISDNETWKDDRTLSSLYKDRQEVTKGNSRLVLWDLQPNCKTPALSDPTVLNVSGLSENVYKVISDFLNHGASLIDQIRAVEF